MLDLLRAGGQYNRVKGTESKKLSNMSLLLRDHNSDLTGLPNSPSRIKSNGERVSPALSPPLTRTEQERRTEEAEPAKMHNKERPQNTTVLPSPLLLIATPGLSGMGPTMRDTFDQKLLDSLLEQNYRQEA